VASNDEWVSISEGLAKGDEVVQDGALYLEKLIEENRAASEKTAPEKTQPAQAAGKPDHAAVN